MKITKSQLRQIIKEELEDVMQQEQKKAHPPLTKKLLAHEGWLQRAVPESYFKEDIIRDPQGAYEALISHVKKYWEEDKAVRRTFSHNKNWKKALLMLGRKFNSFLKTKLEDEQLAAIEYIVPNLRQGHTIDAQLLAMTGLAGEMGLMPAGGPGEDDDDL
jgi:hypothetical protein